MKHFRLHLSLELFRLFDALPGCIVVVVLGPVRQAIRTVVQGGVEIGIDQRSEGYWLRGTALVVLTKVNL